MSDILEYIRLISDRISIDCAKIYLTHGEKAPEGYSTQTGSLGGVYYETDINKVSHTGLHQTIKRASGIYGMDIAPKKDGSVTITARSRRNGGIGVLTKPLADKYVKKLTETFGERFNVSSVQKGDVYEIEMTPKGNDNPPSDETVGEGVFAYNKKDHPQYALFTKVQSPDDIPSFVLGAFKDLPQDKKEAVIKSAKVALHHIYGNGAYAARCAILEGLREQHIDMSSFTSPYDVDDIKTDTGSIMVRDVNLGTSPPEFHAKVPGYYGSMLADMSDVPLTDEEKGMVLKGQGEQVLKRLNQEKDAGKARCSKCGKLINRKEINFNPNTVTAPVCHDCISKVSRKPSTRPLGVKYTGD